MAGNEVRIKTTVTGNAKQEIGGIRDAWARFQREGGQGVKAGLTAAAATKGFALLDTAISGTIGLLGDASRAYMEEEDSIARLDQALAANVASWDGNTDAIEEVIASRMRLGFSDDEQRESLALLTVATKDETKALELQRVAMDLARLKRISLADASAALIKVEGGQFRLLKSLGIELKDNATQTEALAAVQAAATGQAEKLANMNSGKLLASQVRLGEAMEHLGEVSAPIMAEGAEVAADAIEGLGPALNVATTGLGYVVDSFGDVIDAFIITDGKVRDHSKNVVGSVRGMADELGVSLEDVEGSADGAAGGIEDLTDSAYDAKKAAEDLEEALEDLTDSAYDAAEAFGDQAYDADQLKGRMAELEGEIGDAKDELRELEAIKNPTKAQQQDIDIARGKLAGLREDLFGTRLDLAKLDGTGLDSLLIELSKVQYRTDAIGDDAREALDLFRKLSFAAKNAPGYRSDPGYAPRAEGGPVSKGEMYLVGEKGPELFVPNSSGQIYPNGGPAMPSGGGGGWGGGSPTVIVNVHAQGVMTPAIAQQLRDELGPVLAPLFARRP